MRRRLVLIAALTLVLAACGDDRGSTQDGDETFDAPDTTEALPELVVVFSPDESETDSYGEPTTWTPEADDVQAAEAILAEHLETNSRRRRRRPWTPTPASTSASARTRRLVSVNALCEASLDTFEDWEDELIVVNDGGPCFWQATVDLTTNEVDPFTVNGNA